MSTDHTASQETNGALATASFQALLEAAPDAIIIIDTTGQIVLANEQAERLFGYTRVELIHQSVELLMPGQFRERHARHRTGYFDAPRTRPMGNGMELVAQRKDGNVFPVEISLSALPSEQG